jgi:PIN domain nuclease of toxin-antitoxin system
MKILLDSHTLLWAILGSSQLSSRADRAIRDFQNVVYVSAATGWEITTKFRIGKMPQAGPFIHDFAGKLKEMSFQELPVSMDHATRAGLLLGDHKDPFDRMLIAQSLAENLPLISNEELFDRFQVQRIW